MKGMYVVAQPIGRGLVLLLLSKWGQPLLLLGMLILAGSTAAYLESKGNQPAHQGSTAVQLGDNGNQPRQQGVAGPDPSTSGTFYGSQCWLDYVSATPHTCALSGRWPTQADTN